VVVTGSRDWPRPDLIHDDLWALLKDPEVTILTVVWGDHWQGADAAVRIWCAEAVRWAVFMGKDVVPDPHPAAWNVLGKRVGPERNTEMADSGADGYLSYRIHGDLSTGTTDCIGKLKKAEIYCLVEREMP